MIRVLIVDDSPVSREYLKHIFSTDENISVVGVAKDGKEAVSLVQIIRPDVVTMDIQMPRMDGYEATRRIMEVYPVPIVVVSTSMIPEQVENTFRAIKAGAVAAVEKPRGPGHPDSERMAAKVLQTVRLMSEVKVVRRFASGNRMPESVSEKFKADIRQDIKIAAIGASTGGPPVLRTVLSNLTEGFSIPILVVQHIAPGFLQGMVEWLGKETWLNVKISEHGERVRGGYVYFAPDGYHLGISGKGEIHLSGDAPINGLQPSVSYLFRSVADSFGPRALGVILTGMGKDGASELKIMRDKGAITVAQSKESSVVHGMPGEAIRLEAAEHILSPEDIADFLSKVRSEKSEKSEK